jgi:hypothetical protein
VRPNKRSALIEPSLLLEVSSHTLINESPTPDVVMKMFVGTCAITFGIGATLTGLAITLTEDRNTTRRE